MVPDGWVSFHAVGRRKGWRGTLQGHFLEIAQDTSPCIPLASTVTHTSYVYLKRGVGISSLSQKATKSEVSYKGVGRKQLSEDNELSLLYLHKGRACPEGAVLQDENKSVLPQWCLWTSGSSCTWSQTPAQLKLITFLPPFLPPFFLPSLPSFFLPSICWYRREDSPKECVRSLWFLCPLRISIPLTVAQNGNWVSL